MPALQESWNATAYLESGTITRGYVACLNEAGTAHIVSTLANRTAAGRRSACFAMSNGDADNPSGAGFEGKYAGIVPPLLSGLGAGAAELVRVSDAGVLERTASYSTGDDICGYCDTDGTAYVNFALVGLGVQLGASSAPGLPARSIQYYLDPSTLGGAAHATISTDGYIVLSADRTGGGATDGDLRSAKNLTVKVRSQDGSKNVTILEHTVGDKLSIGGLFADTSEDVLEIYSRAVQTHVTRFKNGSGTVDARTTKRNLSTGQLLDYLGRNVNFGFFGTNSAPTEAQAYAGGIGVHFWGDANTIPTSNPVGGYTGWTDPTTHHPMATMPNGDVFDLTDTGGAHSGDVVDDPGNGANGGDQVVVGIQGYPITNDPADGQVPFFRTDEGDPAEFIRWENLADPILNFAGLGGITVIGAGLTWDFLGSYGVEISMGDADVDLTGSALVANASSIRIVGTATLTVGRVVKLPTPPSPPASGGGVTTFASKTYSVIVDFTGHEGAQSVFFANAGVTGDEAGVLADGRYASTVTVDADGARLHALAVSL